MEYLLRNLSELAEKRAQNVKQEAQLWDILSRDLKREAKRREEKASNRPTSTNNTFPEQTFFDEEKLYVKITEASKIMGISRSSIYIEINAGRLPIKKAGKRTLIAVKDIQAWFDRLPVINR